MDNPKITVHKGEKNHFLRVHLDAEPSGMLRFESEHAYTKPEADFRAVMLSSRYGFDRDELPTHLIIEVYPKV
jgi:hypothetical protein